MTQELATPDIPGGKLSEFDASVLAKVKDTKCTDTERRIAETMLRCRITESDLPTDLVPAYKHQLNDSTRRASVQLRAVIEQLYEDLGVNEQERSLTTASERIRKFFELPRESNQAAIESAFQERVQRNLGIPDNLTYLEAMVFLQQKHFLRNLGLDLEATKEQQIKQIDVVSRFGR